MTKPRYIGAEKLFICEGISVVTRELTGLLPIVGSGHVIDQLRMSLPRMAAPVRIHLLFATAVL